MQADNEATLISLDGVALVVMVCREGLMLVALDCPGDVELAMLIFDVHGVKLHVLVCLDDIKLAAIVCRGGTRLAPVVGLTARPPVVRGCGRRHLESSLSVA